MRDSYHVDLQGLHACCEASYQCLQGLLPGWRQQPAGQRCVVLSDSRGIASELLLEWFSDGPWTSVVHIHEQRRLEWLPGSHMQVRVYHDARMAEVIGAEGCRRLLPRYGYPNSRMHQPDEKAQLNRLLQEWLGHYLQLGHLPDSVQLGTTSLR